MSRSSWLPVLATVFALGGCAAHVEVEQDDSEQGSALGERAPEAGEPAAPDAAQATEPGEPPLGEADACEALAEAYTGRALDIGCAVTMHACPNYLRVRYGACQQYEAESVARCVARMQAAPNCEALHDLYDCDVSPVAAPDLGCTP